MKIPLPVGTYDDPTAATRQLINCTAERGPVDGKSPIILRRMPGIDSFATVGSKVRGGRKMNGTQYIVSGNALYSVTDAGFVTNLGVIPGSGLVSMSDNGTTLVIVTGNRGFYSTGTDVTEITDSTFTGWGAQDVDFIDGYFTFTSADTKRLFNSDLNAVTFSALSFTSIDGATDNIVGHIVDHREIFVAKERSCELWYDAGNATGSPFSRSPNGFLEIGCVSGDTLAKIDGSIFWLANDYTIRRLVGNSPQIISTPAISGLIRDQSAPRAFAYTFEDRHYYVLSFTGVTLEYDIRAQEWHTRESYGREYWTPIGTIRVGQDLWVMDGQSGNVGKMNATTRTEFGSAQIVQWAYQPIYADGKRIFLDRLELGVKTGVGSSTAPQIMLDLSYDGQVFEETLWRDLGAVGEYRDRTFWTQLGSGYQIVPRMRMSDSFDLLVFDTTAEIRVGRY